MSAMYVVDEVRDFTTKLINDSVRQWKTPEKISVLAANAKNIFPKKN